MAELKRKILITAAQLAGLAVAALLVWYVAAAVAGSELVVPQPHTVVRLAFALLGEGATWLALVSTVARSVAAFVLCLAVALSLALLVGTFRSTRRVADIVVTLLRALPTIAVILLALVVFPSTIVPVAVAFLVTFPVAYGTFVRSLDANLRLWDVCKVFGMCSSNRARYCVLPLLAKELPVVTQEQLPMCLKVVIAGEVLALPARAIGREMYSGKVALETARVVALTLIVLVMCLLADGVLALARRRVHD